jgi:hypothetical protein
MSEIIFFVEEAPEGGYTARALGQSVFTDGDSVEELRKNVREEVMQARSFRATSRRTAWPSKQCSPRGRRHCFCRSSGTRAESCLLIAS